MFIFLNVTDLDGTLLMVLKEIHLVPKNTFEKLNSNFSCQEISPPNSTASPCRGECVCTLGLEALTCDVKNNVTLFLCAMDLF